MKLRYSAISCLLLTGSALAVDCDCSAFAGHWTRTSAEDDSAIQLSIAKDCESENVVDVEAPANSARIDRIVCENGEVFAQFRMAPGSVDRDGMILPYPHTAAIQKALRGTVRHSGDELFFGLLDVEDRFTRSP